MTDPSKPVHTTTLVTPAMQTPHESLNISVERGLLAAVMGNPAFAPGVVDVYDISRDCRHPELHGQRSGERLRPRERDGARRPDLLPDVDQHRPHDRRRPEQPAHCRSRSGRASSTRTACRSPTTATAATWRRATGWSSSTSPRSRRASRIRRSRDQPPRVVEHDDPADRHPGDDRRQAVPGGDRRVLVGRVRRRRRRERAARGSGADHRHLRRAAPVRGLQHPARGAPAGEPRGDRGRPGRAEPGAGLRGPLLQRPAAGGARRSWPAR